MKKQILLAVALCGMMFTANAQIEPNKADEAFGYQTKIPLDNGDYQFLMHFNTTKNYHEKIKANPKGIYSASVGLDKTTLDPFFSNDCKSQNQGQQIQVVRFRDVTDLMDSLSVADPTEGKNKAASVLLDVPGTDAKDQVYAYWGGMGGKNKVISFGIKLQDAFQTIKSDLSFDIVTLHPGTTGKAAAYKMLLVLDNITYPYITKDAADNEIMMLDTITSSSNKNSIFNKETYIATNVYTTSSTTGEINRQTINVTELLGISQSKIMNKKVSVILYAPATTDASSDVFEPIIGIDNITGVYEATSWVSPDGAIENATLKQDVDVKKDEESPIVFNIQGKQGTSITIQTGGDTEMKNKTDYYFKEAGENGSVKAKDENGEYTIDVPYSYSFKEGDGNILKITDANYVNAELQVTLFAKVTTKKSSYQLEINNGCRFYLDFNVNVTAPAWTLPTGATEGKTISQNAEVKKSQESPIVFALQGQYGEKITIQTDDDATMKANTGYYFKNNGCVKAKDSEGNYTIDVPYTYNYSAENGNVLEITEADYVNAELQVTLFANLPTTEASNYKLAINNGCNFFMNFAVTVTAPAWILPEGATEGATISQNAEVKQSEESSIIIALQGQYGEKITIQTGDDASMKANEGYYFKNSGCVKAKDGEGNYTVDVPYTYNYSAENGNVLEITDENYVNAELQVTLYTNLPEAGTSNYQLVVNNGCSFFMNFAVTVTENTPDNINTVDTNKALVYATEGTIVVENAIENVIITNIMGQTIAIVSAEEAANGISVAANIYLVKTGNTVSKVLVK